MKQNFKLTKDQQTLVEKNLSIVHWVIVNNIHVNPGICGVRRSVSGRMPVALQGRFYLQCRTGAVFNLRQKGCEKWTPLLLPKNL